VTGSASRCCLALLLLAAFAAAGPVGDYLGFAVGRQASRTASGRDSVHFVIGTDSVVARGRVDTATVVAETLYGTDPAWLIRRVSMQTGAAELVDTACESGDTLLRTRSGFGDSLIWLNSYRVPFEIGATWRTGIEGTYLFDLNGDSIMDTLSIWADTSRVADTEDVTVPFGTIPNCFRIERTMLQRLVARFDTFAMVESSCVRATEWYKDSLWSVKESVFAAGPIYTKVYGYWLPFADFASVDVSVLDGFRPSLFEEGLGARPRRPLSASPNPFRTKTAISLQLTAHGPGQASVFDASGRLVLKLTNRGSSFILHPASLPAGAYILRYGDEVLPITKLE
jgi:hypothetical protein